MIQVERELKVKGLALREVKIGEADKLLSLLCGGIGRIDVSGKGVRSLRSPHMAATQIFAYSSFVLRRGKKYYYIAESELIEPFFGIRSDLDRLSLASYIADIALDFVPEGISDDRLLRLVLNTFFALSERKNITLRQIKGAFEMKAADIEGFCPDLSRCMRCEAESHREMYLDVMNGGLVCGDCRTPTILENARGDGSTSIIHLKLTASVLAALRYIISADEKKFLSFNLQKEELVNFSYVCERYLLDHIEHGFHSLDFYKSILIEE